MGKYMVLKGYTRGADVNHFKLVNVQFEWQKVGPSLNNCAIYLMLHMLFYCGNVFECPQLHQSPMTLLRSEVAAILVLSDLNTARGVVLANARAFMDSVRRPIVRTTKKKRSGRTKPSPANKAGNQNVPKITIKLTTPTAKPTGTTTRSVQPGKTTTPPAAASQGKPAAKKRTAHPDSELKPTKRSRPLSQTTPSKSVPSSDRTPIHSGQKSCARSRGMSAVKSNSRGKGDGLGCSIDCGSTQKELTLVSRILRANRSSIKEMPSLRKHVVDYCLLDDHTLDPR